MKSNIIEILPVDDGHQQPGIVCAANEDRFTSTFYSEPLTAFTVGWKDPENLLELLDFIAPSITVNRRFEFKKAENAEVFLSETDDVRAIGSAFKRVEYTGTSVNEKTHNKGLTIRVDHDDEVGDDYQEKFVQLLLQRLYRNEVRRAISVLDAASTNLAKVWDATADPDKDIRDSIVLAADKTGVHPNRILISESAWFLRVDAYAGQDNARGYASYGTSPEQLAQKMRVDAVMIGKARYQSAAATKTRVVTANALYAYLALDGVTKDEPSNIKRFTSPTASGPFRVYVVEHEKFTDISVEHYSNVIITSDLGIRKITASPS